MSSPTPLPPNTPPGTITTGNPKPTQPPVPAAAIRSTFPANDVLSLCSEFGPSLKVAPYLDGSKVMAAIASVESGGGDWKFVGHNCGPRHEAAYDEGGSIFKSSLEQQGLVAQHGADAASSFGPWQMMFINFSGQTPDQLRTDARICAEEFVRWFNHYVIGVRKAVTLADIGEVWNLGHIGDDPIYVAKLKTAYDAVEFGG